MRLRIDSAEYAWDGDYSALKLSIGGRDAYVLWEQKPILVDAGILFLGEEFDDILPRIEFQSEDGEPLTLRGFTRDPVVFALWSRFIEACGDGTFEPGPVEVPTDPLDPDGSTSAGGRAGGVEGVARVPHVPGHENPDLDPGDDE